LSLFYPFTLQASSPARAQHSARLSGGLQLGSLATGSVADPDDTTIPSGARVALSGMIEVLNTLNEQIVFLGYQLNRLKDVWNQHRHGRM
jgi:hypothetical protein